MKEIEVVAAIIRKENKFLATQRGYGEFINMWEFPGGKIEDGETKEEALHREIKEELNVEINIKNFLLNVKYTYPTFKLNMYCYICETNDKIELLEHKELKWLTKNELEKLNWLPADIEVIECIKKL